MRMIFETDTNDLIFHSKIWRTYKCICGCQDVRVANGFEIVHCPDCKKKMDPQLFITECIDGLILSFHRPTSRRV